MRKSHETTRRGLVRARDEDDDSDDDDSDDERVFEGFEEERGVSVSSRQKGFYVVVVV